MEEIVSRIVSELETLQILNDLESQTPFSRSTLSDLQTIFDNNLEGAAESDRLWEEMSTRNLSPALIVRPIAASMDSGPIHLTLLASRVYLSILLSPNSPVFTLFTPIAFLSFLRSLRRSLKQHQSGPPFPAADEGGSGVHKVNRQRKRGGGGRGRGSGNVFCSADEDGEEIDENRFDFKVLFPVLEKLDSVLGRIHLDRFPDSLKSLIQTVAEIPIMGLELYENSTSYKKLSDLCYGILNRVLGAEHGDQTITAAEVLKSLSPAILLLKSQARTFALRFVTHQMLAASKDCDAIRKAVMYLPRYLIHKAPGKSEPRSCAVESIMEIVRAMEFEDQIRFVDYVVKMSKGKSELRLLAVDLVPTLMMSLRDPLGINSEQEESFWGSGCVEALIQRCSDAVAGIRARALSNLAQVLGYLSGDVRSQARLKEVMGFKKMGSLSWENEINDLIRKRCMDEKAAVRKAALILITKSTALLGGAIDGTMLRIMGVACWDPLVSIRKAATSALSEAFRKFSDEKVISEWLHSVPRLITDNESSIQEECENLFLELILDRLSRVGFVGSHHSTASYSHSNMRMRKFQEIENVFPEGVLVLLKGICNGEVAPFVKKICASLGKKKRLKPTIPIALQNIIRTSESLWLSHSLPIEKWMAPPGSWFLLSEVSAYLSKAVNWEFLHHHWQLIENQMEGEVRRPFVRSVDDEGDGMDPNSVAWAGDRVYLLQILSNVSLELPPEPAASLAHDLLKRIEEFNMHSTEVNAHVKALRTLCKRKALNAEEGDTLTAQWVCKLLSKALQILDVYISEALASKDDSFLTPPRSGGWKKKRGETMSRSLLQAVTAVYTIGSLAMVCHSADFKGIVPVLHKIITSGSSEPKMKKLPGPNVSVKEIAPSLYIQSWITMGKICLVDEKLAKRYIPLFVQELERSESAALRNNIVVMMADFCVRYTALVDCYISKITKCLRDPCEIVRRQTFILLSRLLQRDYVKWRGVLFIQFLLSLVDESEKIKQLADFLFGNILKAKAPLLAYNSFVEAIFVLNDCHAHAGHSESQGSRTESKLFSIRGDDEKSRSQRMHIYVSLLKQMAPEHLLATCAKLCSEILAAASDGLLNIEDATGQCVLKDAFQILSCKEIRIPSNRETAADITEMDEEGRDGAAAAAAGGRVVTQAIKRNLIQNAVPIFIELKRLLESKNSPLTGCLMDCLRVLLKDYKNEIDDILVADKQFQKELMYDMQKHEAAKAKSKVAEAVATLPRSDRYPSTPGFESGVSKLANGGEIHSRLAEKLGSAERVASAVADVAAEARVKSVLRDIKCGVSTPPLKSISLPKLKSSMEGVVSGGERPLNVLESLRIRQSFDSDDET